MKRKALWIFLAVIVATTALMLSFIQSTYFADLVKTVARRYVPIDLGVDADFSELTVKVFPPGVVIRNPKLLFREKNAAGFPGGTKIDADSADVTFQLFQLLTGAVTINAFIINGAKVELQLTEAFLASHRSKLQPKAKFLLPKNFSWNSLVRFNFRSVGLVNSAIDVSLPEKLSGDTLRIKAQARELTIGRGTVDSLPSYDLSLDLQNAGVDLGDLHRALSRLQASVEITSKGVNIRNFSMQDGETNLHVNGNIKGDILEKPVSMPSNLSYIARGNLEEWVKPELLGRFIKGKGRAKGALPEFLNGVSGNVEAEGRLSADLLNFAHTLETHGSMQFEKLSAAGWKVDRAVFKGGWKGTLLAIDSTDLTLGDGQVKVSSFSIDPFAAKQHVPVRVDLQTADIRRLVGPELKSIYPLHLKISGRVAAEIDVGPAPGLSASADLKIADFTLDNQSAETRKPLQIILGVKEGKVQGKFSIDDSGVNIDSAEVTLPRSKLSARGTVTGKAWDLDIGGRINAADVGKLAAFDLGGEGNLHWTIKGPTDDLLFTFEPDVADAEYLNLNLGSVKGRLIYNEDKNTITFQNVTSTLGRSTFLANGMVDVGNRSDVNLAVRVSDGTIQDFATVFDYFLKKAVPWYPYELAGGMAGTFQVTGKTDLALLSAEGDMEFKDVDYNHEIFRRIKAHVGYRRGAYVAERAEIRKKTGIIRGNLVFGADDVLQYGFRSEGLSTVDFDLPAALGIPYRAPMSFEADGVGRFGSLKSSFTLSFGEGLISSRAVAPSTLKLTTENGKLLSTVSVLGDQLKGRLMWSWDPSTLSSLDMDARHLDVRPGVIAVNTNLSDDYELRSDVTGSLHIKFPSNAVSHFTGTASLDSFALYKKGYSLLLAKPVKVEAYNGNYAFSDVKITGEGSSLSGNGQVAGGRMDASLKGQINLGIFEFAVPEIASFRGPAEVDARFSGPADAPHLKASISASGVDLRLRSVEQPFESLKFDALVRDDVIDIATANAKFAGGVVRGGGTAVLYLRKVPDLDLKLDLDHPKVKAYPFAFARTSGRVTLKGTSLPYKVGGNVFVSEAMIHENFNLNEGGKILRSSKFLPQKSGSPGEFQLFELGVDVVADKGIFVRNDLFDVEMKANVKIVNTLSTPRLLGTAAVLHGRLLFKDNYFAIQTGNIRFNSPSVLDPEFDLTGQTEMKGYKVMLSTSGSVSDYRLEFQSQPPLSQNDIVNLLTLGITSSEYQNISRENRNAYSRDEMYGLLFTQSGINRGLQEKLGVRLRVDQSQLTAPENVFRARSTTDAPETVAPKVTLQKQITKNLSASVGSTVGVGENQERNANVELNLSRNLSLQGVYEDQRGAQARQSRTSVGADLKFRKRF